MAYFPNVDPAYIYKRQGTSNDPYIPLNEQLTVSNTRVTLSEIPDFNRKVTVKKLDGTALTEITTGSPANATQYKVDYSAGLVFFYSSVNGSTLEFFYNGTGYVSFPASRIKVDTAIDTSTIKTIQDLVRSYDNEKTRWLAAVANATAITTTYPTPLVGDTVQTADNNSTYRFDGNTWVLTQKFNSGILTDLQNRVGSLETRKSESFTTSAGKLKYDLTKGSYTVNAKRISVTIGGVPQFSPNNFTETSPTSITLSEYPGDNLPIVVEWVS